MESCNLGSENMENMEKIDNINQMSKKTLLMIQNTPLMTQNTFFVTRLLKTLFFTAFIATVEKS